MFLLRNGRSETIGRTKSDTKDVTTLVKAFAMLFQVSHEDRVSNMSLGILEPGRLTSSPKQPLKRCLGPQSSETHPKHVGLVLGLFARCG